MMELSKSSKTEQQFTTSTLISRSYQEDNNDQKIKTLLRRRSLLFWLEANKRKPNTIARLYEK